MTVPVSEPIATYIGDGTTNPLSFPHRFLAAADLIVTAIAADGSESVRTIDVHYTVSGVDNPAGGTVTPLAVRPSGTSWRIERKTPIEQPTDYVSGNAFPAESHERALDRLALIDQEQQAAAATLESRAVKVRRGAVAPVIGNDGATGDVLRLVDGGAEWQDSADFKGDKGDPGGNIMSVGSFGAITGMTAIAGTDVIRTTHYGPRAGHGGALYRRWDNSLPALPAWGQGVWWQQALDGSRWFLSRDQAINSDMFGTVGDAVVTYPGTIASGTNVTVNLNNMRRWALNSTWGKNGSLLTNGTHFVDDTIMASLGETFTAGWVLWGETLTSYGFWDNSGIPCARIVTTKNDRPLFSVQGARGGSIQFISMYCCSGLSDRVIANNLGRGALPIPTIEDRAPSDWMGALGGANTMGRYNPGCGVAIDPYLGVSPGGANAYPAPPYNAAAGEATTHYGRAQTSDYVVGNCHIGGFTAQIAIQPCDGDAQGEFIRTPNNSLAYGIYGIVGGNSQARGWDTTNLKANNLHTVIDGLTFGKQRCNMGGIHANWSMYHVLRWVNASTGWSSPIHLINPYCEGIYRIADLGGNGEFRITGARFSYITGAGPSDISPIRGFPLNHIGVSATSGDIMGTRVIVSGDMTICGLFIVNSNSVEIDVNMWQLLYTVGTAQPAYIANFYNALCGGIAVAPRYSTQSSSVKVKASYLPNDVTQANLTPLGVTPYQFDGELAHRPTRKSPAPIWATKFRGTNFQNPFELPIQAAALGAGASQSLTNNVLKTTFAGYFAAGLHQTAAMMPGDIWTHNGGYWAVVRAYDTTTNEVTLHIFNGYSVSGGVYTWHNGSAAAVLATLSAGLWNTYGGRRYGPDYPLWGTFTSGSQNVTAVGRARGASAATSLSANVAVGDTVLCVPEEQGTFSDPRNVITARDDAAKTITGTVARTADHTITRQLAFTTSAIPSVP